LSVDCAKKSAVPYERSSCSSVSSTTKSLCCTVSSSHSFCCNRALASVHTASCVHGTGCAYLFFSHVVFVGSHQMCECAELLRHTRFCFTDFLSCTLLLFMFKNKVNYELDFHFKFVTLLFIFIRFTYCNPTTSYVL
jgi:hypothetical protein